MIAQLRLAEFGRIVALSGQKKPLVLLAAASAASSPAVPPLDVPPWLWVVFCAGTAALLMLDMFVFHRHAHEPTLRESALWTALLVRAWRWRSMASSGGSAIGSTPVQFLTGYLVEWSLSMDNVFVFVVIFSLFRRPAEIPVSRAVLGHPRRDFDAAGVHPGGRRLAPATSNGSCTCSARSWSTRASSWPVHGARSASRAKHLRAALSAGIIRVRARLPMATTSSCARRPLVCHVAVPGALVIERPTCCLPLDSVPAIFGITKEPFIVFTSNVFAIMGLRALYFLLAGVMAHVPLPALRPGAILAFIGVKMLLHRWWEPPHGPSLAVIVALLAISIIASLIAARTQKRKTAAERTTNRLRRAELHAASATERDSAINTPCESLNCASATPRHASGHRWRRLHRQPSHRAAAGEGRHVTVVDDESTGSARQPGRRVRPPTS